MTEWQRFAVGEAFRYRNAEVLRGRELFLLEWDRSGYMLIVALPGMTAKEVAVVRRNPVIVKAVIDGAFVLPFWSFEGSPLYGETPFDPTAYRVTLPESVEEVPKANLVMIVGLDSASMLVRALRAASLPAGWRRVVRAWQPAWDDAGYSARYATWLDRMAVMPLDKIERRAERLGHLGE